MSDLDGNDTVMLPDGREIVVRRTCNRCYGHAISVDEVKLDVVSQYGTAHASRSDGHTHDGHTQCGIRATGDNWRWLA